MSNTSCRRGPSGAEMTSTWTGSLPHRGRTRPRWRQGPGRPRSHRRPRRGSWLGSCDVLLDIERLRDAGSDTPERRLDPEAPAYQATPPGDRQGCRPTAPAPQRCWSGSRRRPQRAPRWPGSSSSRRSVPTERRPQRRVAHLTGAERSRSDSADDRRPLHAGLEPQANSSSHGSRNADNDGPTQPTPHLIISAHTAMETGPVSTPSGPHPRSEAATPPRTDSASTACSKKPSLAGPTRSTSPSCSVSANRPHPLRPSSPPTPHDRRRRFRRSTRRQRPLADWLIRVLCRRSPLWTGRLPRCSSAGFARVGRLRWEELLCWPEQVPSVAGNVEEHGEAPVGLGARCGHELDAGRCHVLVHGVEVVDP